MEDVECLTVPSKDHATTHHIKTVDWERLPGHQTVGLHSVLDSLVTEPRGHVGQLVTWVTCHHTSVPPHSGTVPVTHVSSLTAGEHVIWLARVELNFTDCRLINNKIDS